MKPCRRYRKHLVWLAAKALEGRKESELRTRISSGDGYCARSHVPHAANAAPTAKLNNIPR